ncbi:hypothetical protein NJC10_10110 [Micrococcus sp. M4NT]|uniref:hypothetical protein n=1 Tax=Micrococcus sp. M4NT TaxID=2957501 RepID=UPI0029BB7417|nr:hypothetical protein [Micrococcus sp. M4NT]MDX2342003.1 hypothetical protein [Micrococcus sp. M4NT]
MFEFFILLNSDAQASVSNGLGKSFLEYFSDFKNLIPLVTALATTLGVSKLMGKWLGRRIAPRDERLLAAFAGIEKFEENCEKTNNVSSRFISNSIYEPLGAKIEAALLELRFDAYRNLARVTFSIYWRYSLLAKIGRMFLVIAIGLLPIAYSLSPLVSVNPSGGPYYLWVLLTASLFFLVWVGFETAVRVIWIDLQVTNYSDPRIGVRRVRASREVLLAFARQRSHLGDLKRERKAAIEGVGDARKRLKR